MHVFLYVQFTQIIIHTRKEGRKEAVVPENMCSCMSVSVLLSKFTLHSIFHSTPLAIPIAMPGQSSRNV